MGFFDPGGAEGSKLSAIWRKYVKGARPPAGEGGAMEASPDSFTCGGKKTLTFRLPVAEPITQGGFLAFDLPQGWGGWASEKDERFLPKAGAVEAFLDAERISRIQVISRGSRLTVVQLFLPRPVEPGAVLEVRLPPLFPCERPGRYRFHALIGSAELEPRRIASPLITVEPGAFSGFDLHYPYSAGRNAPFALTLRSRTGPDSSYATVPGSFGSMEIRGEGLAGLPETMERPTRLEGIELRESTGRISVSWNGQSIEGHPVVSRELTGGFQVLFGDLHLHTEESDGMGSPEEAYCWAREGAGLDFVALNDHVEDRLTRHTGWDEEKWRLLLDRADEANDPGRFVTIAGVEISGSINLYFKDRSYPFFPFHSLDGRRGEISKFLTAAARDRRLLFGYHKLGELDDYFLKAPPPNLLEIIQHKRPPAAGLERFLGICARPPAFLGGSDSHHGLAGSPPMGLPREQAQYGLTGVLAEEKTREGVFAALQSGRTFVTAGQRSVFIMTVQGVMQGGAVEIESDSWSETEMVLIIRACSPVRKVELLVDGRVVWSRFPGVRDIQLALKLDAFVSPENMKGERSFLYARMQEEGGKTAWTSPIMIKEKPPLLYR